MPRISVLGTRRGSGLGFSRNFGSSSVQDAEENWDELIDLHSDLREVMETFQTFDEDKDMRLNRDELLVAMTTIGQPVDDNLITEMIDSVAPGQDSVNFSGFLALMSMPMKSGDVDEEVLEAFKIVDVNGDGFISFEDLDQGLRDLGEDVSKEELINMVESAAGQDGAANGKVNYDDFLDLLGYHAS
mmetsp:Transcript_128314/g.293160  ORF Transcript_128314/g.293160 Transcript_128314/m.293160 type:complete len:187 (-) Transcript_128314:111-671(-)|eukprot:CAMPEP_0204272996 /NCGR_PEP_ID=MMETSP0468-20130131/22406_1 /ASSEMBLY_ACC=CAM_ASM_000383 /TAXON_ID=2969 /ORGANISM="Oxyrrhis marina" /LENGTH=186 /DNA_ID=CAMNT_0051248917 /DNA_START=22 /DNA_END=582 /DNA_ORIENTATION=+